MVDLGVPLFQETTTMDTHGSVWGVSIVMRVPLYCSLDGFSSGKSHRSKWMMTGGYPHDELETTV